MKKFLAVTIIILSSMCLIAAITTGGIKISKLSKDNIQTEKNVSLEDTNTSGLETNTSLEDAETSKLEKNKDLENIQTPEKKASPEDVHKPKLEEGQDTKTKTNNSEPGDQDETQKAVETIKSLVERKIDPQKPMVALTFDDGPHPKNTMRIVDCLKKHNSAATFFVLGNRAENYKNVIKSIIENGNQIGNHTYDHKQLTRLSSTDITDEMTRTDDILRNITNSNPSIMRPTYGSVNSNVKLYAGAPIILWSIDTLDWKTRNEKMIVNAALKKVKDGDIILMHDIYRTTAMAAEVIIEELSSRGYQMVTIDELYKAKGINLVDGKVYAYAHKKK